MEIKVRTDIPYGNACNVSVFAQGSTPVVAFAADPRGGPEALWFCLRLEADPPASGGGKRIKLVLRHPSNLLGVGDPVKLRPVFRQAECNWQRLPAGTIQTRQDGREEVYWLVEAPKPHLDIDLCYPYGRDEIEGLLEETGHYWRQDTIGASQSGRPLLRLSNYPAVTDRDRPGIFLVARQHSGETPGSWVMDGFLREVASLGEDAPLVWAVPLANADGVEEGRYGKDNYPYDLNRSWGDPPMRHEVLAYRRDMDFWLARCEPLIGLDLHAPGGCEDKGIYAFLPSPETSPECHRRASLAASLIGRELGPEYAAEPFAIVPKWLSRWNTPGFVRHCCSKDLIGLGLETPYSLIRGGVLDPEDYREAGRRIARSVVNMAHDRGL